MAFRSRNRGLLKAGNGLRTTTVVDASTWDWDFSDSSRMTFSGSNITSITDATSGVVANSTGGVNIGWSTATQNGRKYATNNGGRLTAAIGTIPQPYSLQVVCRVVDLAGTVTNFWMTTPTSGTNVVSFNEFNNNMQISAPTGVNITAADTNWHVWYIVYNGANSKAWKDQTFVGTFSIGTNSLNGVTLLNTPDASQQTQNNWTGRIRIWNNGSASDSTVLARQQAMQTLWGI